MNVMKTSLTIIPMCPRERFSLYKSLSRLVPCYKKDWAIFLHIIYFHYLLPVTNYLISKLSVTYNFSACREYLAENRLSFPLLLVGFDTLTYRKDYDRPPILVGHHLPAPSIPMPPPIPTTSHHHAPLLLALSLIFHFFDDILEIPVFQ